MLRKRIYWYPKSSSLLPKIKENLYEINDTVYETVYSVNVARSQIFRQWINYQRCYNVSLNFDDPLVCIVTATITLAFFISVCALYQGRILQLLWSKTAINTLQPIRNAGNGPPCLQNNPVGARTTFEYDLNTAAESHIHSVT